MLLFNKNEVLFPEKIKIDGQVFEINADFRNILRIIAILKDNNIADLQKICKIKEWFFKDFSQIFSFSDFKISNAICNFINCRNLDCNFKNYEKINDFDSDFLNNSVKNEKSERQFCYEFDGAEIYVSFLSEYNIDLAECGFLHWFKFKIMLENLSESSAFKKKIALRFLDLSGISRENSRFSAILEAKEALQLPRELSFEDEKEIWEFENFWERT